MADFKWLILAGVLGLGACTTTSVPQVVCPKMEDYSIETQKKAAKEIKELNKENKAPTIRQFMVDYGALRERLRAVNCK